MKKQLAVWSVVVVALALFQLIGCQSKEITSAKVYIQQNNWDKAIEQLEHAIEMYPTDAEAFYLLGEGYSTKSDWERMTGMFKKSLEISSKFEQQIKNMQEKHWVTSFNSGVGKVNANNGNPSEEDLTMAQERFENCAIIDPTRGEAYRNLAFVFTRRGDMEGAKSAYERLVETDPNNVSYLNDLAPILIQMKEYDRVVEIMQKAVEKEPANVDAVSNLALAYDFLGQSDKAKAEYEKALENNPDDKDLMFNLARLNYIKGQYDEAIKLFQRVIELNPDDYDANLNVGNAFLSMAEEARKSLVENQENGKEVSEEEVNKLKDFFKRSIPYLEKALTIQPENASVWNNLGVAYVNIGDADKGQECFDKAEQFRK